VDWCLEQLAGPGMTIGVSSTFISPLALSRCHARALLPDQKLNPLGQWRRLVEKDEPQAQRDPQDETLSRSPSRQSRLSTDR